MEAVFVTERIILLLAPEDAPDNVYRPHIKEVSSKLQSDYGQHYFIMNVSEPRTDLLRLNTNVMDFGWPAALAPPLEKLCSICKQADVWLNADIRNVLVIHCKGGLGRAAVLIAGYLHYTSICGSASQARDRYAINSLFEKELQKYVTPSQRRFIQYFSGLLKGSIRICGDAVYLHAITLQQVPNFDGRAACRPSFKIYQSNEHVWTSEIYSLSELEGRNILTIQLRTPVQLRGDIMIKCHHHKKLRSSNKDIMFRCQLHTCAIEEGTLLLTKWDLDEACNDIRFPNDGRLELTFSRSHHPFLTEESGVLFNRDAIESERSIAGDHGDSLSEDKGDIDHRNYQYQVLPVHPVSPIPEVHLDTPEGPTYAKVNKKRPPLPPIPAPRANLHEELELTPPSSSLHEKNDYRHLSNSFDSGISAIIPESSHYSKMERRTVSPGGTMKSVKFREGDIEPQDVNWRSPPTSSASLRNGMDVVDLDSMQPELDELDRVFESLQAETESLDRMTSKNQSRDKKPSFESRPPPLRQQNSLTRQDSNSKQQMKYDDQSNQFKIARQDESQSEDENRQLPRVNRSDLNSHQMKPEDLDRHETRLNRQDSNQGRSEEPSQQQDSGLISGYVPQDRKGLAKKFGAFTFGLPTGKPELKSINSPPPVRRGSRSTSDTESHPEDMYGRNRLRHVQDQGSVSDTDQRKRAEEKLYSSAAPAAAVSPSIVRNLKSPSGLPNGGYENGSSMNHGAGNKPPVNTNSSLTRNQDQNGDGHYDTLSSQPPRPVNTIPRMINQPIIQDKGSSIPRMINEPIIRGRDQQQREPQRSEPQVRPRSPQVPRPRTPTQEERLERLLNVEEREFLVTSPDEKGRPALKEIAKEYQENRRFASPVSSEASTSRRVVETHVQSVPTIQYESEGVQTDPDDDEPIPERKKQKRSEPVQTTSRPEAGSWLQMQHDKLMTKRYGTDHKQRMTKEDALLKEIKETHKRASEQVPNRDLDENRLPLSSIVLHEAKTPPLSRKHSPENPGYALVKKQVTQTTSKMSVDRERKPENKSYSQRQEYERKPEKLPSYSQAQTQVVRQPSISRPSYQQQQQPQHSENVNGSLRMVRNYPDSDHDSVADEVDFADEPLYKSPPATLSRQSRSREIDDSRVRQVDLNRGSFSNPTSPDILRKANASPKSILKNASLQRSRNATSEDRNATERERERGTTRDEVEREERPTTPNFPQGGSLQRNYSLYGTRDRSSGRSTPTGYYGMGSRRSSLTSLNNGHETDDYVIHHHPVFVRDLSRFWYRPQITREEAITMLRDKPAGTFLIRDSNSFPGAFGLAVKVDQNQLPAGTAVKGSDELVRHFLIEPSPKGVHLKGCANEPIFGSLPALVYQHSVTPLALPCRLLLPDSEISLANQPLYSEDNLQRLMETGAACNVFYLVCVDTESLTGPQAIRRAMTLVSQGQTLRPTIVHFKVNSTGVILTDNKRKLFFRRHYPINTISFCGLDPDDRRWSFKLDENSPVVSARCFGFVSRKRSARNQNECHIFAELEDDQPAGAVVSFVTKVMMSANSHGQAPH